MVQVRTEPASPSSTDLHLLLCCVLTGYNRLNSHRGDSPHLHRPLRSITLYSRLLVHSEIYLSSNPFTKGRRLFRPGSASDKWRLSGSAGPLSLQVPADLLTRRYGDTTITEATRTVMEKWGLEGFKFVLGETKNVYEEKRKVRERDKVGVNARTKACVFVCKGESGLNKMPFLSAWHTLSATGSYIMSRQQTTVIPAL